MDGIERILVEADCSRLIKEFSRCTDTFDYDRAMALFVPDCTFSRADDVYNGIDGLRAALNRRASDRRTCHIVSSIIVDVVDGDNAHGGADALVFGYRGNLEEGEEVPLGTPDSIVRFEAGFRRTDAGWRIAKWHIGLNFRKPAE